MDSKVERVVEAGRALGVAVEPHRFPEGTRTAADAAAAVGCEIGQIVKSLVFGSNRGPLLFLVSGANRLDVALAASVAGATDLHKADAEEARRATGFSIGATHRSAIRSPSRPSWTKTSWLSPRYGRLPAAMIPSSASLRPR